MLSIAYFIYEFMCRNVYIQNSILFFREYSVCLVLSLLALGMFCLLSGKEGAYTTGNIDSFSLVLTINIYSNDHALTSFFCWNWKTNMRTEITSLGVRKLTVFFWQKGIQILNVGLGLFFLLLLLFICQEIWFFFLSNCREHCLKVYHSPRQNGEIFFCLFCFASKEMSSCFAAFLRKLTDDSIYFETLTHGVKVWFCLLFACYDH